MPGLSLWVSAGADPRNRERWHRRAAPRNLRVTRPAPMRAKFRRTAHEDPDPDFRRLRHRRPRERSIPALARTVWPDVDFEWYANVGKPIAGDARSSPRPRRAPATSGRPATGRPAARARRGSPAHCDRRTTTSDSVLVYNTATAPRRTPRARSCSRQPGQRHPHVARRLSRRFEPQVATDPLHLLLRRPEPSRRLFFGRQTIGTAVAQLLYPVAPCHRSPSLETASPWPSTSTR